MSGPGNSAAGAKAGKAKGASAPPNTAGSSGSVSATAARSTPATSTATSALGGLTVRIVGLSILVAAVALLASWSDWWPSGGAKCEDRDESCEFWAENNECNLNPEYMSRICTKACKLCSNRPVPEKPTAPVNVASMTDRSANDLAVDDPDHALLNDEEGQLEQDDDYEEPGDDSDDSDDGTDYSVDGSGAPSGVPRILTSPSDDEKCVDSDQDCPGWADRGECDANPRWMRSNCRKSCGTCGLDLCVDVDPDCSEFASRGECEKNPDWMLENCKKSCGSCGDDVVDRRLNDEDGEGTHPNCHNRHEQCEFWASEGECDANPTYMHDYCRPACGLCAEDNKSSIGECADKHPQRDCEARAADGECERNPGWMIVMCGKTCGKCDLLLQKKRCIPEVFNDTGYLFDDAVKRKGDLTHIFERVLELYPQTEVLLRPPQGPWIVKLPKFVTDLERDTLLNLTLPHVKRSTDQGAFNEEGVQEQVVSTGRTSYNAWCFEDCGSNPVVRNLTLRVSDLLTVPPKNFESFQVLRYRLGQKYDVHHDSSEDDMKEMSGPRILTFFIYFSDVEEGGETEFNKLGIRVKPERNSAILWPSILDEDPSKIDWRTTHAALPVIRGEKLAANLWVHQRDFTTPNLWGCTGAFD